MDQEDDVPPFAISELSRPLHFFAAAPTHPSALVTKSVSFSDNKALNAPSMKKSLIMESQSFCSPPGLVESVVTDGSCSTSVDDSTTQEQQCSYHIGASSHFMLSSLPTISSALGNSSLLPDSHHSFGHPVVLKQQKNPATRTDASGTFSQLMRAADGGDLGISRSKMPSVPEDDSMEGSTSPFGALISSPFVPTPSSPTSRSTQRWFPSMRSVPVQDALREPLLDDSVPTDEPGLIVPPSEAALQAARAFIRATVENDHTFEVSMEIPGHSSFAMVMNVLGNPDLLRLWCDPIQSLVVTSTSDGSSDPNSPRSDGREYEGEWIEATTTALESPPCPVGQFYRAGQAVFDALGCASYGRITMFVERRRGQVGLTIGPFSGGIQACHHISVSEADGRVRIVDRVRLTRDAEGASMASQLLCGVLDSCLLKPCLVPSVQSYMNQVSTSMARLQILVVNDVTL